MILKGKHKNEDLTIELKQGEQTLGRSSNCDISVKESTLSKRHAKLIFDNEKLSVADLESSNGTYVNGIKINTQTLLSPGDELRFGKLDFKLVDPNNPETEFRAGTTTPEEIIPDFNAGPPPTDDGNFYKVDDSSPVFPSEEKLPATRMTAPPGKRNQQLLMYGGGGLIVVVLILLVISGLISSSSQQNNRPVASDELTNSDYDQLVGDSLKHIDKNEFKTAGEKLSKAAKGLPAREIAPLLLDVNDILDVAKGDLSSVDEFEKLSIPLNKLFELPASTEKIRLFSKSWLQKIETAQKIQDIFYKAQKYEEQENCLEAVTVLQRVPRDSVYRKKAEKRITELKNKLIDEMLTESREAKEKKNWPKAIKALKNALQYMTKSSRKDIEKEIDELTEKHKIKKIISNAEKLVKNKKYSEAETLLQTITDKGVYEIKINSLLKTIQYNKFSQQAIEFYNAGQADEAKKAIDKAKSFELIPLKRKIEEVVTLFNKGKELLDKKKYEEAVKLFDDLLAKESFNGNFYRKRALQYKKEWNDPKKLANYYMKTGDEFFQKKMYKQARENYEKAVKKDPEGSIGSDGINRIIRIAGVHLQTAMNIENDNPAQALSLYRDILKMLLPGDKYYKNAMDRLEAMGNPK